MRRFGRVLTRLFFKSRSEIPQLPSIRLHVEDEIVDLPLVVHASISDLRKVVTYIPALLQDARFLLQQSPPDRHRRNARGYRIQVPEMLYRQTTLRDVRSKGR